MNIIFLDVDGVLNSMAYFKWLKESGNALHKNREYNDISDFHLQMLAKIYHTCNAHIVLTSPPIVPIFNEITTHYLPDNLPVHNYNYTYS